MDQIQKHGSKQESQKQRTQKWAEKLLLGTGPLRLLSWTFFPNNLNPHRSN